MKKSLVVISAAAVVLTFGVVGCGAGESANSTGGNASVNVTSSPQNHATAPFPVTLKDDAGHMVTISKQPQRIASTTEGTDEILTALVPKSRIVLVTSYADEPQYSNVTSLVKGIPTISSANAEQVIAAKPDLVLMASYTNQGVVRQIEQAGIPSYEFNDFTSIPEIEHNIKVVGKLVGSEQKATKLVQQMQTAIGAVQNAVKGQKKVTVLDYSSYGYVAGAATTVNNIIVDAGGINAAAKLNGWQEVSNEEIVKMNPQVIIDANDDKGFIQKILSNPALQDVAAVKDHRVYAINSADLTSVSQYVTRGVQDVAKVLYPNAKIA